MISVTSYYSIKSSYNPLDQQFPTFLVGRSKFYSFDISTSTPSPISIITVPTFWIRWRLDDMGLKDCMEKIETDLPWVCGSDPSIRCALDDVATSTMRLDVLAFHPTHNGPSPGRSLSPRRAPSPWQDPYQRVTPTTMIKTCFRPDTRTVLCTWWSTLVSTLEWASLIANGKY